MVGCTKVCAAIEADTPGLGLTDLCATVNAVERIATYVPDKTDFRNTDAA